MFMTEPTASLIEKASARIRRGVLRRVLRWKNAPFRESILSGYGLYPAGLKKLSLGCALRKEIAGPSRFSVTSPHWFDQQGKKIEGIFPEINANIIKNAIATPYCSAFASGNDLLMPDILADAADRVLTDEGGLFTVTPSGPFVFGKSDMDLDRAIHIGGAGAFNWYHFIIECLPKAFLSQRLPSEFDDVPFLLPVECREVTAFSDAISAVSGNRAMAYLPRGRRARVRELIVLDEVSSGPFNLIPGEWPKITDYSQSDEELLQFFNNFRNSVLKNYSATSKGRRLFLSRPGVRRNYNQEEILGIARRYGFEAVFPEKRTLREQAELFAEASAIVGPSGAAWVGMIFSERQISGLTWVPDVYREFCSYSTLADLLGHDLTYIEAQLFSNVASTGDVYKSEYTVSAVEFEDALRGVLGESAP